ncbi:MAG: hypothetical protein R2713_12420 [Ilumatobacteraceae bacterium]|nr:hypothetical protein [Acidimicrobiales bacterium]MCB9392221.1 hypothetical protein [Acidimicrobiaceae bacterium]
MKLLHTSEWHVGKQMRGNGRADEHRAVLREAMAIADEAYRPQGSHGTCLPPAAPDAHRSLITRLRGVAPSWRPHGRPLIAKEKNEGN